MIGEGIAQAGSWILNEYQSIVTLLPGWAQSLIGLFALAVLITLYLIIVWHGSKILAKKDPLKLDLNQYNTAKHPVLTKVIEIGFYFAEFLVIAPIVIFIGFSVFTVMLALLSEGLAVKQILFISAIIIAVIRITAYYKESLSEDVAKLIPFTLLAVALSNFLDVQKVLTSLSEIPTLMGDVGIYLLFVIGLEIILQIFDFIFSQFNLEED